MSKILAPAALFLLGAVTSGIIGCSSSSNSASPSPLAPPPAPESQNPPPKKTQPAIDTRTFEEIAKSDGLSIIPIDNYFFGIVNDTSPGHALYIQHGQFYHASDLNQSESYCQFGRGNDRLYENAKRYRIDKASVKNVGQFGTSIIQFTIRKEIIAECGNSQVSHGALTVAEFQEIMKGLAKVVPTEKWESDLGQKAEVLRSSDGNLQIGIQYATKKDAVVSVSFTIRGSSLVGNKIDMIAPSYIGIMDKESRAMLATWHATGLGNSYMTSDSTQGFNISETGAFSTRDLLKYLHRSAIVISTKKTEPSPSVYIDLEEICQKYPEKVVNLDTGKTGCP